MPAPVDESYLYEPDAVLVGVSLFGSRTCTSCGEELPENSDYFVPDVSKRSVGFLTSSCRRCRRAQSRRRYRKAVTA